MLFKIWKSQRCYSVTKERTCRLWKGLSFPGTREEIRNRVREKKREEGSGVLFSEGNLFFDLLAMKDIKTN